MLACFQLQFKESVSLTYSEPLLPVDTHLSSLFNNNPVFGSAGTTTKFSILPDMQEHGISYQVTATSSSGQSVHISGYNQEPLERGLLEAG